MQRIDGNHDASVGLTEEQGVEAGLGEGREIQRGTGEDSGSATIVLRDAALGQCNGKATLTAIVGALDAAVLDES